MSVNFTSLKSLDRELVSQLKERLSDPLFEKLNGSLLLDQDRLKFAEYKIRVLEERLRLVRIEKYGSGSEKLSDAQLELLELEPGVSHAEVKAESERGQLHLPLKNARKHPGRQELPTHLPRVEKIIACTPEQCICGNCGKQTRVIGYETSEQLDVKPAQYFVVVTKREKRACKECEEQALSAHRHRFGLLRKVWPVIGWSSIQWSANTRITYRFTGRAQFWSAKPASNCPERL